MSPGEGAAPGAAGGPGAAALPGVAASLVADPRAGPPPAPPASAPHLGPVTRERLKWVSLTHSCIYIALLVCAFALSKPEPLTFALGLGHGLLWIGMSLTCVVCARWRIVSLKLAVAVAVLGGIGPFFGTYEFMREGRRRPR